MLIKPIPPGHTGFDRITEAVTTEFGQLMDLVRQALRDKVRGTPGASDYYVDVSAIYADRVVSRIAGRLMAYPYKLNADNTVTVGDGAEVVMQFASVREAVGALQPGDQATFREAADGSIEVTIIQAGTSKNGVLYPDAALREAVSLFEGCRVFNKADAVHKAGGGKDVAALLGGIYSVRFMEGATPDTGRLVGTFKPLSETDPTVIKMTEAVKRGMQGLMGLSIDADARTTKAGKVRTVRQFTRVHSVDLIVEPGAGGGLDRLTEAATDPNDSTHPQPSAGASTMKTRLLTALALISATAAARLTEASPEIDVLATLTEACDTAGIKMSAVIAAAKGDTAEADIKKLLEAAKTPAPAGGQQRLAEGAATMTVADFEARQRLAEARFHARTAVAACTLPQAAKDKLLPELLARDRLTEADVDNAIKGEREYLARFSESGRPTGGMPRIEVGDRTVVVADMLDAFFDPAHNDHRQVRSFRECYAAITGDRYVTGTPDRARLTESVGTDTFAQVLGNSITRRLQQVYTDAVRYDSWRQVVSIAPVNDFRTQERTQMGGFGDLPIVAERGPYNALSDPSDDVATYAVAKRGGISQITMEAIKNDDVGAIRRIPQELGRAAKRTLYKFVFNFFAANAVTWDGIALYHASHANLFTGALSATELALHRLAMKKQLGRDTATRMEIGPRFLLVPDDLEETAFNLFNRNTNNDKTFIQSQTLVTIPVSTWTDVTDWVTVADPMDIPVLEIGFLDGQEEPTLLVQDSPTEGSVFTNDMITYKMRHPYGGTILVDGHKGTTKAVVAG